MGSEWRRLNKTLFWISFGVCIVGSLVGAIICWAHSTVQHYSYYSSHTEVDAGMVGIGFGILGGGILFTLIAHSFWGMILEFFYNVEEIKNKINSGGNGGYGATYGGNTYGGAPSGMPAQSGLLSRLQSISAEKQGAAPNNNQFPWQCPGCGETNPSYVTSCQSCGTKKP